MTKTGDMPVPVVLTRDQVRLIRGMVATTETQGQLLPVFQEVKDVLDAAETVATIQHAQGNCYVCGDPVGDICPPCA